MGLWYLIVILGYLEKLTEPKKKNKVPQRAVIHCSLWYLIVILGYLEKLTEPKKNKVPQRAVIHCSLWHLIVVFRLSREANRTKKKIRYHREQLYTALCGTLWWFLGYLEKLTGPKKK